MRVQLAISLDDEIFFKLKTIAEKQKKTIPSVAEKLVLVGLEKEKIDKIDK